MQGFREVKKSQSAQNKKQEVMTVYQSNLQLQLELKNIRKVHRQKQQQLFNMNKQYRIQIFKNKKMKEEQLENQKIFEDLKRKRITKLIQQYKDNKESPLFHNENGLAPFEMMLLEESRYTSMQGNICMICFLDLENNTKILILPCHHSVHKQCGVQHLLYSHNCPACNQIVKVPYQ